MSLVTLYHGTSISSARKLIRQKRWDPEKFGSGADIRFKKGTTSAPLGGAVGFYGKGLYLTSTPEAAANYAQLKGSGVILEVDVDGEQIVWADSLNDDELVAHLATYIKEGRRKRGRAPLPDDEVWAAAQDEIRLGGEPEKVKVIRDLAEVRGLGGVAYNPYEIVVWGDNVIKDVRPHEESN